MSELIFFGNQELVRDCNGNTATRFRNFLQRRSDAGVTVGVLVYDGTNDSLSIHQLFPPTATSVANIDLDHRNFFTGTRPTHPEQNPALSYRENCVNVSDIASRLILSFYGLVGEINTRHHTFKGQ